MDQIQAPLNVTNYITKVSFLTFMDGLNVQLL